ncbi:MAG: septum formation protein Maf [Spirochaetales bacterium]|nr:MAG: septum formation protein Maf [Spirochaetales bacterium]
MTDMFTETILLASASPRRRELLESIGVPLLVASADIDESISDHVPIVERVRILADLKAHAVANALPDCPRWILGADTLVTLGGRTFGKPIDSAQARSMLMTLAGATHTVVTGLALLDSWRGTTETIVSETAVTIAVMSEAEIEFYVASGEWEGAAGGYRIQERAALFVERVDGSYSGIVGLPLREFYVILARSGYPLLGGTVGAS